MKMKPMTRKVVINLRRYMILSTSEGGSRNWETYLAADGEPAKDDPRNKKL